MNSMLTLEEVRTYLETDQPQVEKLLKSGKLQAYKIGGTYIRFRKEEVLNLRSELQPQKAPSRVPATSRLGDFWRFNNFYIISLLVVVAVIVLASRL